MQNLSYVSNENELDPIITESDVFNVYKKEVVISYNVYQVYLSNSVEDSHKYDAICNLLRMSTQNDIVLFYLANFGGSCHGLVNLVNAVKHTKASVFMLVTAPCYSAGATLAISGDYLYMYENTFLMFHNYSAVSAGKGEEMRLDVEETKRWIHGYFRMYHKPFLTECECKRIENDKDIYVRWDDKDIHSRISRHFKNADKREIHNWLLGVGDESSITQRLLQLVGGALV
jgi:ATP-dependent protease ClpP protease subunit